MVTMDPFKHEVGMLLTFGGEPCQAAGNLGHVGGEIGFGKIIAEIDMPVLETYGINSNVRHLVSCFLGRRIAVICLGGLFSVFSFFSQNLFVV